MVVGRIVILSMFKWFAIMKVKFNTYMEAGLEAYMTIVPGVIVKYIQNEMNTSMMGNIFWMIGVLNIPMYCTIV